MSDTPIAFRISAKGIGPQTAQKIYDSFQQATSGNNVSGFLGPLDGQTFYITVEDKGASVFDADYKGVTDLQSLDASAGFYSVDADGDIYWDADNSNAPTEPVQQIGLSLEFVKSAILNDPTASAVPYYQTPFGVEPFDAARSLFHELAHAVTLSSVGDAENYGDDEGLYSGTEALAVAAENYIWVKDHGGLSRIGHLGYYSAPLNSELSFDPASPFLHVANIAGAEVDVNGGKDYVFGGATSDFGQIQKAYGNVTNTLNFIAITGSKPSILGDGVTFSQTFNDALSGMLADSERVDAKIATARNTLSGINALSRSLPLVTLALQTSGLNDLFSFDLNKFHDVVGNSNERFKDRKSPGSNPGFNYVGPVSIADGSSSLGFEATTAGILIGSSGFDGGSETSMPQMPNLKVSHILAANDHLKAFSTGTSLLIAGDGNTEGQPLYNQLVGGTDGDIFIGGDGSDEIYASSSQDLVIQSLGKDIVHGNGKTVFALTKGVSSQVIDMRAISGGKLDIKGGSENDTSLFNVRAFVGNDSLTTFVGNGRNPCLFIAGTGGGDFRLTKGDVAIGSPTAASGNTYRVSSKTIGDIAIVNFGANDKLYVDDVLFKGENETFAILHHQSEVGFDGYALTSATGSWDVNMPSAVKHEFPGGAGYEYYFGAGRYSDVTIKADGGEAAPSSVLTFSDQTVSNGGPLGVDFSEATTATFLRLHVIGAGTSLPGISFTYATNEGALDHSVIEQGLGATTLDSQLGSEMPTLSEMLGHILTPPTGDQSLPPGGGDPPDNPPRDDSPSGLDASGVFHYFSADGSQNIAGGVAVLRLSDLRAADVVFSTDRSTSDDAYITIKSTGATMRLGRQLSMDDDASSLGVQQVLFVDGTVWDRTRIQAAAWFRPGAGDQNIDGYGWDNTFVAGTGNDHVKGHDGSDTYLYAKSAGNFDVEDYSASSTSIDTLKLSDLTAADVTFYADYSQGNDVYIRVNATGNTIRLERQNNDSNDTPGWGIEQVEFADGTTMDRQQIRSAAWLRPGAGDQNIDGYGWDNTFVAGTGNDHVRGHDGSDTYLYAKSAGNFDVEDYSASSTSIDTLKLTDLTAADVTFYADYSQGNDVYIRVNATGNTIRLERQNNDSNDTPDWGIEQVEFADGTTMDRQQIRSAAWFRPGAGNQSIDGYGWDNTFVAGSGNDHVRGYVGNDTYVYSSAAGNFDVEDYSYSPTLDTLKLTDLNAADVTFYADRSQGEDIYIRVNATGNTIRVERQNNGGNAAPDWGIEQVVFADDTTWDRAQIQAASWFRPGDGDLRVDGYSQFDNTFVAGTGSDHFVGFDGQDTYVYASSAGDLLVDDYSTSATSIDTLKLADLNVGDVTFVSDRSQGDDSYIRVNATGKVIRLDRQADHDNSSPGWGIEQVIFGDGTTWGRAQIQAASWFRAGSGNRRIDGYSQFDNTFVAGAGSDHMVGYEGSDTYLYASADGDLLVDDYSTSATSIDTLKLTDLNIGDVTFFSDRAQGDDGYIRVNTTGKVIRLDRQFAHDNGSPGWGIEQVVFADGTTWDRAQIQAASWFRAGDSDGRIDGYSQFDNTFVAGAGSDHMVGFEGSDTYLYASANGNLLVDDYSTSSTSIDTLKLTDLNPGDVSVYADSSQGNDIYIRVKATGRDIRLDRQVDGGNTTPGWGIEQVVFADGTAWTRSQLWQQSLAGPPSGVPTEGDDMLVGTSGNDVINPKGGNDTVVAGTGTVLIYESTGDDIYVWNPGDGHMTISGGGWWDGFNTIRFGPGIAAADLSYAETSDGSGLVISIAGQQGSITIDREIYGGAGEDIDQLVFADGSSLSAAQFVGAAISQISSAANAVVWMPNGFDMTANIGAGNATIYGQGSNDRIVMGTGNDLVYESGGDDTYVWKLGDGDDIIRGSGWWDGFNTVEFGVGISASALRFTATPDGLGLVISVVGQPGSVTIENQLAAGSDGAIDQIKFADGSVLNRSQFTALIGATPSAPQSLEVLTPETVPIINQFGATVQTSNGTYQLTPDLQGTAGNIWGSVDLSADALWVTRMYFGQNDIGADGIAFSLSALAQAPLDSGGFSLGALNPGTFGFKFDTFQNPDHGDPNSDFSQFVLNGNVLSSSVDFDAYRLLPNIEDGQWHDVAIKWNATSQTLSYSLDGVFSGSHSYDVSSSVLGGGSLAYFAFGAATGAQENVQDVQIVSVGMMSNRLSVDVGSGSGTLVGMFGEAGADASAGSMYEIVDTTGHTIADSLFEIDGGNQLRVKAGVQISSGQEQTHGLLIKDTGVTGAAVTEAIGIDLRTVGSTIAVTDGVDLTSSAASDTFVLNSGFGNAMIEAFDTNSSSHDLLQVDRTLFSDWAHLLGATTQFGSDLKIEFDDHDSLTLKNVAMTAFTRADVHFA